MIKIVCPSCGAEYLPQEIYIPNSFFGDIKHLEKDENGKITDFIGEPMDFKESYKCDFCSRKFYIMADVKFDTESNYNTFETTYVTKISKPSLFMKED